MQEKYTTKVFQYEKQRNKLERSLSPKNVLTSLFSKQFLGNVKNELVQKSKSSKFLESVHTTKVTEINKFKNEMNFMAKKLKELTKQNEQLRETIKKISVSTHKSSKLINIEHPSFSLTEQNEKLKINSKEIQIFISHDIEDESEELKLRERIVKLQGSQLAKDKRLIDLLEKQARLEGEIMLLKTSKKNLEEQVYNLRESIKVQLIQIDKPLKNTNISNISDKLYPIEEEKSVQPLANQLVNKMGNNFLQVTKNAENLLDSHCNTVQVPKDFHLSQLQQKDVVKVEMYNSVDQLLQEQLPNFDSMINGNVKQINFAENGDIQTSLSYRNDNMPGASALNDSIVKIDLNGPSSDIKNNINESVIAINI